MSRIGKLPITIPAGVEVKVNDENVVNVKGPLGELSQKVDAEIEVAVEDGSLSVSRAGDAKRQNDQANVWLFHAKGEVLQLLTLFQVGLDDAHNSLFSRTAEIFQSSIQVMLLHDLF